MLKRIFTCVCAFAALALIGKTEEISAVQEALRQRYGNAYLVGNQVTRQVMQNPNASVPMSTAGALENLNPDYRYLNGIEQMLCGGFCNAFSAGGARLHDAVDDGAGSAETRELADVVDAAQKAVFTAYWQLKQSPNLSLTAVQWTALATALDNLRGNRRSGNGGNDSVGDLHNLNGINLLDANHKAPAGPASAAATQHLDTAADWLEVYRVAENAGLKAADTYKLGPDDDGIFDNRILLAAVLAKGKVNPAQLGGVNWTNAAQNANMPSDARALYGIVRLMTEH